MGKTFRNSEEDNSEKKNVRRDRHLRRFEKSSKGNKAIVEFVNSTFGIDYEEDNGKRH
jgi:hypothetical protein